MISENLPLSVVFEGWGSYQDSLAKAIAPLTPAQLAWRAAQGLRSVGEIASHISVGRIDWFHRMGAPGSAELAGEIAMLGYVAVIDNDPAAQVGWLESSWQMIAKTLDQWRVADLTCTYKLSYRRNTYAVSRQWTIWRILAHDIHHGGQIAMLLGIQGIDIPELGDQGGHLIMPRLAESR